MRGLHWRTEYRYGRIFLLRLHRTGRGFHISDYPETTISFAAADFLECYVDLFLAAASVTTARFSNKTLGGGEAHTAVAAGD